MKYIISESQYQYIKEGEYSPQLNRRYSMIKHWLKENLPMLDLSFYDLDEEESIMMYVINSFLEQIRENDYFFDVFHEIPQQDILDFIFDNFKDMIMNYVRGV